MGIGTWIRHRLGPLERPLSAAYRGAFVSLDHFVEQLNLATSQPRILEVGCGEGALAEKLALAFPSAQIVGIDIAENVGRLYRGRTDGVSFQRIPLGDWADRNEQSVDVVLICDVLHHVPWNEHQRLLQDTKRVLAPRGRLILKDWDRSFWPIHWFCFLADRVILGDEVRYAKAKELRSKIEQVYGASSIQREFRVRPWKRNVAFEARVSR